MASGERGSRSKEVFKDERGSASRVEFSAGALFVVLEGNGHTGRHSCRALLGTGTAFDSYLSSRVPCVFHLTSAEEGQLAAARSVTILLTP